MGGKERTETSKRKATQAKARDNSPTIPEFPPKVPGKIWDWLGFNFA